jgi:hypothetical protein
MASDRTVSLSSEAFARLSTWSRELIFPMLQPGHTVALHFVDHEPGRPVEDPHTVVLDARLRQFRTDVLALDDLMGRQKQASRASQTDLGKLFSELRHSIEVDRQTGIKRSYVLVALTDGIPDGVQTRPPQGRQALDGIDYRIVVLGAEERTESALRAMAVEAGFADGDRMLVVPHALVDQSAAAVQRFIGRPVNAELAQSLKRASAPVAPTER